MDLFIEFFVQIIDSYRNCTPLDNNKKIKNPPTKDLNSKVLVTCINKYRYACIRTQLCIFYVRLSVSLKTVYKKIVYYFLEK